MNNQVCVLKLILSRTEFSVNRSRWKIDKGAVDYYTRLTSFYAQYRAIGVNYNQVVKALNSNFSEQKALAYLYKLEKATIELVKLNHDIIELTRDFELKWLQI